MNSVQRSRRVVFTLNNPENGLDAIPKHPDILYCVYQLEKGENQTPHLQGYMELKGPKALSWLRNNVSDKAHFEVAKGSAAQNRVYCTKDEGRLEGPREWGEASTTRNRQGKRTDLEDAAKLCKEQGIEAVREQLPGVYMRYQSGLKAMHFMDRKRKRQAEGFKTPKIIVYWGETGAGKTSRAFKEYPDLYRNVSHASSGNSQLWMDGYDGQKEILFDDFCGGIKFQLLLQILDGYPLWLPVKGSFVMLESDTYIFTSNVPPEDWYGNVPDEKKAAFYRRLKEFGTVEYMCCSPDPIEPAPPRMVIAHSDGAPQWDPAATSASVAASSSSSSSSESNKRQKTGGKTFEIDFSNYDNPQ